eukprot:1159100-Pelagomonas_calceolata.AAC.4
MAIRMPLWKWASVKQKQGALCNTSMLHHISSAIDQLFGIVLVLIASTTALSMPCTCSALRHAGEVHARAHTLTDKMILYPLTACMPALFLHP